MVPAKNWTVELPLRFNEAFATLTVSFDVDVMVVFPVALSVPVTARPVELTVVTAVLPTDW
jgi:hypothetical protein